MQDVQGIAESVSEVGCRIQILGRQEGEEELVRRRGGGGSYRPPFWLWP